MKFFLNFVWTFHQWQQVAFYSLLHIMSLLPNLNSQHYLNNTCSWHFHHKQWMKFSSRFSFWTKESTQCTNLRLGKIWNYYCHIKHTISTFLRYPRYDSTANCEKIIFLAFLLALYLYFPNLPHISISCPLME